MTAPETALHAPAPRVMTADEVCTAYRISRRTLGNWCASRRIPFLKLGRTLRFRAAAVDAALAKFEIKAAIK